MEKVLEKFMREIERRDVRVNGAVIMSGGEVAEEIYRGRYTSKTLTRMYSSTKSVAALAIGRLLGEGKVSLDDRIVDLFADRFDMSGVHPYMREQTLREMLTMTTSLSSPAYSPANSDWLASYFRAKPTHPSGTVWNYDSSGSYVIGALTKHLTGLDFIEYLRPIFDKIGVSPEVYSLLGPDGEAWAPSGMMATVSDLARIAYLLVRGGEWNGERLLPADFARDAISPLVRNGDDGVATRFNCGYGYQIWSHPGGAFAFRGLGGQIAIGYPARDLVFSCISDSSCNHNAYDEIFDAVEYMIMPEFPEINPERRTDRLLPRSTGNIFSEIKDTVYLLDENPMGLEKILFTEGEGGLALRYTRNGEDYEIGFLPGEERDLVFPEKYSGYRLFDKDGFISYKCSVRSEWLQPNKLYIRVFAEDLFVGNASLCFAFRGDSLGIKLKKHAQFFFDGFDGYTAGHAWRD